MKIIRKEMPYKDDAELWENGTLGESEQHTKAAPEDIEQMLDDGLGLEMISIRLQKSLVKSLKVIAQEHGLGYQPFIRQILTHHVKNHERKQNLQTKASTRREVSANKEGVAETKEEYHWRKKTAKPAAKTKVVTKVAAKKPAKKVAAKKQKRIPK